VLELDEKLLNYACAVKIVPFPRPRTCVRSLSD